MYSFDPFYLDPYYTTGEKIAPIKGRHKKADKVFLVPGKGQRLLLHSVIDRSGRLLILHRLHPQPLRSSLNLRVRN